MKLTIDFDSDKLINEIMSNYPEAGNGCTMQCTRWKYETCLYKFEDTETGKTYTIGHKELTDGLERLLKAFFEGKHKGIGSTVKTDFQDAGMWDAFAADALVQYAIFKELIYG